MFPELTRKPHPTHEQSRYSFSSVHNVELGNSMKEESGNFNMGKKWENLKTENINDDIFPKCPLGPTVYSPVTHCNLLK